MSTKLEELLAQQAETILSYQHQNSKLVDQKERLEKKVKQLSEENELLSRLVEDLGRKHDLCPYCHQPKAIHSPTELELCEARLLEPRP